MTETENPGGVDRRSSAISRITSPYGPLPSNEELEERRNKRGNQFRHRLERWAPGQDPNDPDAHPDSGYEYVKLEVTEGQDQRDPYADLSGPDAEVRCWNCHQHNYRIIGKRSSEEVGDTQDTVKWARAQNRPVDALLVPDVIALFCPGCKHQMQLREQDYLEAKELGRR